MSDQNQSNQDSTQQPSNDRPTGNSQPNEAERRPRTPTEVVEGFARELQNLPDRATATRLIIEMIEELEHRITEFDHADQEGLEGKDMERR